VANLMSGSKFSLCTDPSIHPQDGACLTEIFSLHWSQMWRIHRSKRYRGGRIKALGEPNGPPPSSSFVLNLPTPHRPCRTISNPGQFRTSNVEFKADHNVSSSRREYPCLHHLHNINRSDLRRVKQQQSDHGKWALGIHDRTSGKPKWSADRPTVGGAGSGANSGSRSHTSSRRITTSAAAAADVSIRACITFTISTVLTYDV
jgi:hypothetical protein